MASNYNETMFFVKIDNYWWKYDITSKVNNATVYNRMGGRQTKLDLTGYEIVQAKDWQYLDWSDTSVLNSDYKSGWLSPEAIFYGCDYSSHSAQASLVHNCSERQLEQKGWIKITYIENKNKSLVAFLGFDKYYNRITPTEKQLEFLLNYNF